MAGKLQQLLERSSREGCPSTSLTVGGRLHDSAIGAIYFAKSKGRLGADGEEARLVLKTLDLAEQNLWAVTFNNKRTTVRGLKATNAVFMSGSKTEAKEWRETWCSPQVWPEREGCKLAKVCWLDGGAIDRDGATSLVQLNEYLNEGLVGLTVSKHLGSVVPHVVHTHDVWISDATGFILQDYGGNSLMKSMGDLGLADFKSIVVQTLVALAIGQETIQLKHHDVHLDNVFVNRVKASDVVLTGPHKGARLDSAETWQYGLKRADGSELLLSVPHHGVLAKIGDFGLASVTDPDSKTRLERADYALLDATEFEWGSWNGTLLGQQSYDAVVFLCKFFLEDEVSRCPESHVKWARQVYKGIKAALPAVECSTIGRPFRGREGHMRIADILALPAFSEFHVLQDGVTAIRVY